MSPPPSVPGFTVVWSDDFAGAQGSAPDTTTNWRIISAPPNLGNSEVQTYTADQTNVSLSGQGSLNITPQKDSNGNWTSGRLESNPSFSCDVGAKMILQSELCTGTSSENDQAGIWPAFWALGDSIRSANIPWPECGEWDIMENAHGVGWTLASLHYAPDGNQADEQSVGGQVGTSAQTNFTVGTFNTFALQVDRTPSTWQDETLTWSLNGVPWFTVQGADVGDETLWANCAQKAYYTIFNVAVGSNFPSVGGQPDEMTVSGLGSGMQMNYVAFYKSTPTGSKTATAVEKSAKTVGSESAGPAAAGTTAIPVQQRLGDPQAKPASSTVLAEPGQKKRNRLSRVIHRVFA